jgi:Ni,Fe-hydrogenase III large subunit
MSHQKLPVLKNGQAMALADIPEASFSAFRGAILDAIRHGHRLACLCTDTQRRLFAVLADDAGKVLRITRTQLDQPSYAALTPDCPQAHLFEREMAEQYGLVPEGHPWLKPVRFQKPWFGGEASPQPAPGVLDFYRVEGDEVHEVAVGPVHAGVIEPGHFRFQCHGEKVFHLEIALGYQHRGVEQALEGGPHPLSLKQAETACGDTSIGHAWAYCQNLEGLAGVVVSDRASRVRGVALELERAANHVGDLGALSGDVGFQPTAAFCGRIRGDWLNFSAEVCGSRLGRNWLRPGGLQQDLDKAMAERLLPRLERTWVETQDAVELLWGAASVLTRFEAAGHLGLSQAREIGVVGVPARACGIPLDVRRDHPFGPYDTHAVVPALAESGNVHSRAWVRWRELFESHRFLSEALCDLQQTPCDSKPAGQPKLAVDSLCVSLTEGWRGEVLHLAITDQEGKFSRYKIVDASFHNWFALALVLRGEQISDFPLCNKSFNLSYCGHDL